MNREKELEARIEQLERQFFLNKMTLPPEPDPTLGEDEWWATFTDFRKLEAGCLSKIPWQGGSNMTSTFKVKRV